MSDVGQGVQVELRRKNAQMKVAVFALFPLFLFASLSAQPSEILGLGGQNLALGGCQLFKENPWRSYQHPAVLGRKPVKNFMLSLYSSAVQNGLGIHAHGVATHFQWSQQGIGLGLQKKVQPGVEGLVFHFGYGRKIFSTLYLGICFERNSLNIPSETIRFEPSYSTSFSAHYTFSSLLSAAIKWRQDHHLGWRNDRSSSLRIGLDWNAGSSTQVLTEWGAAPPDRTQWHFGLLHNFRSGFTGLFGLGGMPLRLGWGLRWEERDLSIGIFAMWSPVRPGAGAVEIVYGR